MRLVWTLSLLVLMGLLLGLMLRYQHSTLYTCYNKAGVEVYEGRDIQQFNVGGNCA